MGGQLRVESRVGHGAAFSFSILAEMAEVPQAASAPATPREQTVDLPPLKVIVADDNLVNRKVAVSLLKHLGYQADSASDAKELLARMQPTAYHVVFMDVQMPEIDGLEATRRIRAELPADRQPRIVAPTAGSVPRTSRSLHGRGDGRLYFEARGPGRIDGGVAAGAEIGWKGAISPNIRATERAIHPNCYPRKSPGPTPVR
jgi:CheY-like chemotaxis protein